MSLFKKLGIKSTNDIEIGYVLELKNKIGLESDTKEFSELVQQMNIVKNDYKSSVILIDTTELIRWDTYGLRAIIPTILHANKELATMGRAPIGIIGDTSRDIFDAIGERWANHSKEIPWFKTTEEFRAKYRI